MPEQSYYPLDTSGKPKALIYVSEGDKIGLDDYGNVTITASVSRFVSDDKTSEEFQIAHKEISDFLDQTYIDQRRDKMREELKG